MTTTYDLLHEAFGDGRLQLTHEILLPVHHTLIGLPGAQLSQVQRVLSHPVALGQCRIWLGKHLGEAELVSAWDTAGSVEIVAREGNPAFAAIAVAARRRRIRAGAARRADRGRSHQPDPLSRVRPRATTRRPQNPSQPFKTSLIVCVDHKPGSLALTLQAFGARGVNVMALQSRPERSKPWTYRFYVDVAGAATDPRVAEALEEIEALAAELVILGTYEASPDGALRFATPIPTPAHHVKEAGGAAGGPAPQARGHGGGGRAGSGSAARSRCSSAGPARSRARR